MPSAGFMDQPARDPQTQRRKTIRNDRLLGAIETPVNVATIRPLRDLAAQRLQDIEHFFVSYNEAQGRTFRVTRRADASAAEQALRQAIRALRASREP
jgi:inorganic pyrophosphatase